MREFSGLKNASSARYYREEILLFERRVRAVVFSVTEKFVRS